MKHILPSTLIFILLASITFAGPVADKTVEIRAETIRKESTDQIRFSLYGESRNLFITRCDYILVLKYKNDRTRTLKGKKETWQALSPLIVAVSSNGIDGLESYTLTVGYGQMFRGGGEKPVPVEGYTIHSTFVLNPKDHTP